MASRKVTLTLPEDLAEQLLRLVPARDRSRYVAQAIADKLHEREKLLIEACDVANADPEVLEIEREWDGLSDDIREPWTDASTR